MVSYLFLYFTEYPKDTFLNQSYVTKLLPSHYILRFFMISLKLFFILCITFTINFCTFCIFLLHYFISNGMKTLMLPKICYNDVNLYQFCPFTLTNKFQIKYYEE